MNTDIKIPTLTELEASNNLLRYALQMSMERWQDLAEIIREHGHYDNAGYCAATARRCQNALKGKSWMSA